MKLFDKMEVTDEIESNTLIQNGYLNSWDLNFEIYKFQNFYRLNTW